MSDQDPTIAPATLVPAPETFAPPIMAVPTMTDPTLTDVTMQTAVETTLGELTCFWQKTDAAGHVFQGYQINYANSNDSAVIIAERDTTGRVIGNWRILPVSGFKLTTSGPAVAGADLLVLGSGHHISNEANRQNQGMVAILPGVFTPPGEPGDSAFPESVLLQGPTPPSDPSLTKNDVRAAAVEALELAMGASDLFSIFPQFQKAAKNGATQALDAHGVGGVPTFLSTPDALLQVLKDGLYQWQLDRIYQVLHDNGLIPPHTTATAVTGETNTNAAELAGQ